jgi:Zn finger protein HypA/HybF involved in hydrogenase expression
MANAQNRTTDPGYENRDGQIVVRNTRKQGTDFGQHIYELRCKHCGEVYGANESDIYERKCPACQGGRPGIPVERM